MTWEMVLILSLIQQASSLFSILVAISKMTLILGLNSLICKRENRLRHQYLFKDEPTAMILGRGTAQTDEAIIAEFCQFLEQVGQIRGAERIKDLKTIPALLRRRIEKPILQWSDEEILAAYEGKTKNTEYRYSVFLSFLFYRGYHRPSMHLLKSLPLWLHRQWRLAVASYQNRLEQVTTELGYFVPWKKGGGYVLELFLGLLVFTGKTLEELTRDDFEAFRAEYLTWYAQNGQGKKDRPDPRLFRLERYLVHWGIIPALKRVAPQEERVGHLQHEILRQAILAYLRWCEVKLSRKTVDRLRAALQTFFLWLQEHFPEADRLDAVSRSIAQSYAQYLAEQVAAGRYSKNYHADLYSSIHRFFDFVIDERMETSPARNPFSPRDLPRRPDMIPRYIPDQELRKILAYCEHEVTLFERTLILTLLHTGIRSLEFTRLKASDIVQIGGVWKLHIHEGKGLKDRLIPLTAQCLAALQTWQEQGWERINDALFTRHGWPLQTNGRVQATLQQISRKLDIPALTAHRFRHTFAVALLNYGLRETALQKLMGHATLGMTLEYARILDETVEKAFSEAVEQMQDGVYSWVPNFFVQEEYTLLSKEMP
jgi:site-specific recombinase XerD